MIWHFSCVLSIFARFLKQIIKIENMKLKIVNLILCIGFLSFSQISAQDMPKTRAEQMPTYPGCEPGDKACSRAKLMEYVQAHIQMPEAAKKAEKGGVAMVSFVIAKNGSVSDVNITKDPGHGMGVEAKRVIEMMNKEKIKWMPGMNAGKKVAVQMVLPVSFNISLPEKEAPAEEAQNQEEVYTVVEDMPRFDGCADVPKEEAKKCTFNNLIEYVQKNLQYPAEAKGEKIEGAVMTSFVITKAGKIEKVKISKGLSKECDAEAMRIVSEMPVWVPGIHEGEKVNVQMILPIQFKLSKTPDAAPTKEKTGKKENEK
jgi:TonB family protein